MHTFEFIRPAECRGGDCGCRASQNCAAGRGCAVHWPAALRLIDLMKLNVETPARLLDINRLPFDKIEELPTAG